MHDDKKQKYLDKGYEYFQKEDNNFHASVRQCKDQNRFLSSIFFHKPWLTVKNAYENG